MVRRWHEPAVWVPPLAVVGVIAAFTAGLSLWYSTFGWVAWGPRLTLPILPAVLVAAVRTAGEPLTVGLHWFVATVPRAIVTGGVVALLGLAQVGVVWNAAAIQLPLVLDAACPQIVPVEQASARLLLRLRVARGMATPSAVPGRGDPTRAGDPDRRRDHRNRGRRGRGHVAPPPQPEGTARPHGC